MRLHEQQMEVTRQASISLNKEMLATGDEALIDVLAGLDVRYCY